MAQEELTTDPPESENASQFNSEFSYLYKNSAKSPKVSQQERREILLKEQKEKRHNVVDSHRDLTQILLEDEGIDFTDNAESTEDMDVEQTNKNLHKSRRRFSFMDSEWFTEVPEDLEENWLIKLAPIGSRVLVIAKKHHTVVYHKRGKLLTMKTYLPGGGLDRSNGLTVLDGIYNKPTKTIFILDCIFWNTMSMLDSETTFRFYWLKNKFDENFKLSETNKNHKFQVLEFFPAQKPLLQDKIFEPLSIQNETVLHEGVVFYHKEVHYTFGETPLLGWLYSYMLPEKLGIDVPQENMARMPKDYECLEKYLAKLKEKKKKSFKEIRKERSSMDTS